MTLFWLIGAGLALAALAWLLRPLAAHPNAAAPSRNAANLAVYRDQLRELEADRDAGTLATEDYERARTELEARLLRDVGVSEAQPARRPGRAATWAVGVAVPIVAVLVYLLVGSPSAIDRETAQQASAAQVEAMVERL